MGISYVWIAIRDPNVRYAQNTQAKVGPGMVVALVQCV